MASLKENLISLCNERIDEVVDELRSQPEYQELSMEFNSTFKRLLDYLPEEHRKELFRLEEISSKRDTTRLYSIYKQGLLDSRELMEFIGGAYD